MYEADGSSGRALIGLVSYEELYGYGVSDLLVLAF